MVPDRPLLLLWDGAALHRREQVKRFLETENHGRSRLEQLAASSPALNAAEQVRAYLKRDRLKHLPCQTLAERYEKATTTLYELMAFPNHVLSFFRHPDIGYIN